MKSLLEQQRFSFLLEGKDSESSCLRVTKETKGNETISEYSFSGGLRLTNCARIYPAFNAIEWVNYLQNEGNDNTPVISQLWDCDVLLPCHHRETEISNPWSKSKEKDLYVINPNGSTTVDEYDFHTHIDDSVKRSDFPRAGKAAKKIYSPSDGRSSEGNAPFFNIHDLDGGYIVAVGWTGQWNAKIELNNDTVRFCSKIEDTEFYLKPGEKIRTSSVLILRYEGSVEDSQNLWRRFLREELSPLKGRVDAPPFILGFWGGTTTDRILSRTDFAYTECGIPFDTAAMDAGWCGATTAPTDNEFLGDWSQHVGDWVISPLIHKNGLTDVAEKFKSLGLRYSLWFEPERIYHSTPIVEEHPEYLLAIESSPSGSYLLNLGNEEALSYCTETICAIIEKLNVGIYRQDFNIKPLEFWRRADEENRKGITEIKYIMGLYRFWDTILERFPKLFIDNCASGGKRLDIETLRRSIPLWRSDAQCPADPIPEISQLHQMNFPLWMPYSGTGSGRLYDTYRMRSAYGSSMSTTYSYSANENFGADPDGVLWLKKHAEEYLRVRPYFDGDIYHLTAPTRDMTAWCAVQWDRPELGDGMIQVFKRENAIYKDAYLPLRKISDNCDYRFTDLDGGEFIVSGKELIENGLHLTINESRVAKIYIYEALS